MKNWFTVIFVLSGLTVFAQQDYVQNVTPAFFSQKDSSQVSFKITRDRKILVGSAILSGYGGSFIFLSKAWYNQYAKTPFHTFNDVGEWNQMDKAGHTWTAYTTSRLTTELWKWAGCSPKASVLIASSTSLAYMLSIEYLDGRSAQWGWSWGDAFADLAGAGLFSGQELLWHKQKIQVKFSSHPTNYSPELKNRAQELFGNSLPERTLKDYNTQTYWLSMPIHELFKDSHLPPWLSISIGYGAEGMFGGFRNIAYDKNGDIIFDRQDIKRYRQWYLAPDIDLTKIKTNSKVLKRIFFVCNSIKIPAPALEFSNGRLRGHLLYF